MKLLLGPRTANRGLATLVATLSASLALATGSASAQGLFVNELHYDNVGEDQDEGVEVAGPAGMDLSAYSLELYSGADGRPYARIVLSGTLADQQNGHGTSFFAAPALQNGAPDGLALLGPAGVEQVLGYEGTFVATLGDAAGKSFLNIGRFEAPSTPVDQSLQLQGTGRGAADFEWNGPLESTPGQVNTGQQFSLAPPATSPPRPPAVDVSPRLFAVDDVRPRLGTLAIAPRRFTAAHSGPVVPAAAAGGRVFYRLSEAATTAFTVERAVKGRKRGKRCLKPGPGKPCTRYVKRGGGFTHRGAAGINSFRFMGRLSGRSLAPGRYRLVAVATDAAGNRSATVKRGFRIIE